MGCGPRQGQLEPRASGFLKNVAVEEGIAELASVDRAATARSRKSV